MMKTQVFLLGLFTVLTSGHVHNAVETEMFAIPISPNLFNWTYQEFDQQYRFHAALMGKPELPSWLRYIYSGRHHSGFIFGTPPRGTKSPITLEVIGLNRQDYETRRVLLTLQVHRRDKMAKHEVELKIDNLNVEDLLDEHRMTRLKDIFRSKLWPESNHDMYATFLASAIDLGARLPLKPSDGEGLVVRLGSTMPFSTELKNLREEVRPLSKLPSCPREYKRTTVERLFRDAGLTLDWCSFELYNTVYRERTTDHIEYLTPIPPSKSIPSNTLSSPVWSAPARHSLPTRGYGRQLAAAAAAPLLLLVLATAALTATVCFHYAAMRDPESDYFLETIFHICSDYRRRRGHKSGKVELCRYGTSNTEQTQADNTSNRSVGVSPNNSLARPYSPKSSTNLAANYNRPQPPPYGTTLHHRRSIADRTPPTSTHTPEHRHLALEDSLKLLNEANIANSMFENLKEPIVDLNDGTDDYVPVKPDGTGFNLIKPDGYVSMKDLDDIDVPDLGTMGSLSQVSVLSGARRVVPTAPIASHLNSIAGSDAIALIYTDESCTVRVSYAELHARTNALARALVGRARPTGPNRDGDYVVAVCMQPTHSTVMALLASWKAGAAYVPMEPSFPQQRINHILEDAQPALVIYDDGCNPAMFTASGVPSVSFEELALEASGLSADTLNSMETLVDSRADSIAIVLYTSGSTGIPKGVRLPYSAICNRLWWQFHMFPFADSEETCVWKTALTFLDSVCEIWGPLLHGRSLLILSRETTRDPQKLVRVLAENQIQRLVLVPSLLRSILMYLSLNSSERPLQNLKLWVCSGETLSKELAAQFFQYFGDHNGYKLGNFYGSTEVMADVTYYVMENSAQLNNHNTIPIGLPLDNCEVYLLDDEMQPVRESEVGEVWVAGACLACGYVGGESPEKFRDNPHATSTDFGRLYRTGDFGMLEKGVILYAGRTDSQIKIRGHRVDLQEVERAVFAVNGVEKAVVLCYGQDTGNPEILAFVTIKPTAKLGAHHIEAALKNALTSYMIPQVIIIDTFPLLVSGKVDRKALLQMYEITNNKDGSDIPLDIDYTGVDCGDMEKAQVLFSTVGEVLGRAARGALSVRAGFYELGGNSLNSIYTITRLRDKGYYIEVTDFLEATNLGEVLLKMSTTPDCPGANNQPKFKAEPMRDEHKQDVIKMIATSFCVCEKAERKQFLRHEIRTSDYAHLISGCWAALLRARLSVVLRDDSGTPVAVALNFDARDKPELELTGGFVKTMAFLEFIEGSVRDSMLPEGKGTILHSFMMATAEHLKAREKVAAIFALEHATLRVARDQRFHGVFATNTSPLTQQLGRDILGFQTLLDYQVNQFVDSNGDRIFGCAPDDMRAIVCWKTLD